MGRAFGSILKEQRKARGQTQVEIAEVLGVAQSTYNALELRWDMPSRSWIERLESHFALPPGYFDYVYDAGTEPEDGWLDRRERGALVMVLRALGDAFHFYDPAAYPHYRKLQEAVTVAAFMWPEAWREAQADDDES